MKSIELMAVVCLAYFASACEFDQTEIIPKDDLSEVLEDVKKGVLRIGENTYIFNDNSKGIITKFKGNSRKYKFLYDTESLNIKPDVEQDNYRLTEDSFQLANEVTGEYVKFVNVDESKSGFVSFDVELSNGLKLENVTLEIRQNNSLGSANSRTSTCYICGVWIAERVLDSILDSLSDDIGSNCALAMNLCFNGGGVPEMKMSDGWFSSSCEVSCTMPE
jgi:hypothetical protein